MLQNLDSSGFCRWQLWSGQLSPVCVCMPMRDEGSAHALNNPPGCATPYLHIEVQWHLRGTSRLPVACRQALRQWPRGQLHPTHGCGPGRQALRQRPAMQSNTEQAKTSKAKQRTATQSKGQDKQNKDNQRKLHKSMYE